MSRQGKNHAAAAGLPGYVRGWCGMARSNSMQRGYRDVGYLLVVRIRGFRPAWCGVREWRRRVAFLDEHAARDEKAAVRAWFKAHFPALMNLIPASRHGEFVAGFLERQHEDAPHPPGLT